jgi:hypothetical protein
MMYEYRLYSAVPGTMPTLQQRYRDTILRLFDKHGFRAVGFWDSFIGTQNSLHYILEWDDLGQMERGWKAFRSDPEWLQCRKETEGDGPMVLDVVNQIWTLTDYSPKPVAQRPWQGK